MNTFKVTKRHLEILKRLKFRSKEAWNGYQMCGSYEAHMVEYDMVWEFRYLFKKSSCFYNRVEDEKLYKYQSEVLKQLFKDIPMCLRILSENLSIKAGTYVYNEKNFQWELKKTDNQTEKRGGGKDEKQTDKSN